jgi:hypothetical protein
MRLNRVACGGFAGAIGLLAAFLVGEVETRLLGTSTRRSFWVTFLVVGGAVLWVADWFGLLASPYTPPTFDIYEKHDAKSDANDPARGGVDWIDVDEL